MDFNETVDSVEERTRSANYEGGISYDPASPEMGLYKLVVNNLLEDKYYTDDDTSLEKVRVAFNEAMKTDRDFPLKLAAFARQEMGLRDVSQLLLVLAANSDPYTVEDPEDNPIRDYAPRIIQRLDETATVFAIHDSLFDGTAPKGLKKGVADAFVNIADPYTVGKYTLSNREVNIHDVVNRAHVRNYADVEEGSEMDSVLTRLMEGELDSSDVDPIPPPRTWETIISERGSNTEAWDEALSYMPPFARIRNIRNLLEAGIDGEEIINREQLSNDGDILYETGLTADAIYGSNIWPFRLYSAYKAVKESGHRSPAIETFLSESIDVAAENVPDLSDSYVAVDLSGSMDSGLSSDSVMTYKEIGILFGSVLMGKGARAGGFGDDHKEVYTHADSPTLQTMETFNSIDREVGNSTNTFLSIDYLTDNQISVDRIVMFTDMIVWDSRNTFYSSSNRSVKDAFDDYRDRVNPETSLYMIDMSSYGDLVTPEGYENVYNVSGWSEKVLSFVEYAEQPNEIIEEIRNYV